MPQSPLRIVARGLAILLVASAVVGVLASGMSAKDYGTFAFWSAPEHITYCGRQYVRDPHSVHGTPQHFVYLDRGAPTRWRQVGRTFALRPIYATVLVHAARGRLCAGTLYVPSHGTGDYVAYALSGGP